MDICFNKNDYQILDVLNNEECYSSLRSWTIQALATETKLSIPKIRITIKSFLLLGYIKEGAKSGNSKTFYITKEGVEFLNKGMTSELDNIEEE